MKLVFGTNNVNKILEIQKILPKSIQVLSLESIGCFIEIPETGETIEENAAIKANYIKNNYGYDCFADDTGLEVEALHGAPGVFSARYAGPQRNDEENIDKLLKTLENEPNRKAHFKTVIALNINDKQYLFTGIAKGEITLKRSGFGGFGYDSVFRPENLKETFAEISMEEKNKISHRGKATQELIRFLHSI